VVNFTPLPLYLQEGGGGGEIEPNTRDWVGSKVGLGNFSEEKSLLPLLHESRDSADGIAAIWTVRVSVPERGKSFSLLRKYTDPLWSTPSLLFNGYQSSFPGLK